MEKEKLSQLEKLEIFFSSDTSIKRVISSLAFDETKFYNEDYIMRYSDELANGLKYLQEEFEIIVTTLAMGDSIKSHIQKNFDAYNRVLANCGNNPKKLQNFYRLCISDISPELAKKVKQEFVGYSMGYNLLGVINQNVSINGLLHIIHSYVMNNEELYQSVDSLGQKMNEGKYPIELRGNPNNQIAVSIFEGFPMSLDVAWTDIVALKNKTLIMVRDRGHALTIEVEEYSDGVMIRYFIPKLCNIDMINALPGINKVPSSAGVFDGAKGEFISSKEEISNNIYNFIARVPTDFDMVFDFDKVPLGDDTIIPLGK